MTIIEKRNAARSKTVAIVGTLIFHVILVGYLYYTSNGDSSLLEMIQGIMPAQTPEPTAFLG